MAKYIIERQNGGSSHLAMNARSLQSLSGCLWLFIISVLWSFIINIPRCTPFPPCFWLSSEGVNLQKCLSNYCFKNKKTF